METGEVKKEKMVYDAPKVTQIGSIETLTLGPWGGRFDSLFGVVGGFRYNHPGSSVS